MDDIVSSEFPEHFDIYEFEREELHNQIAFGEKSIDENYENPFRLARCSVRSTLPQTLRRAARYAWPGKAASCRRSAFKASGRSA